MNSQEDAMKNSDWMKIARIMLNSDTEEKPKKSRVKHRGKGPAVITIRGGTLNPYTYKRKRCPIHDPPEVEKEQPSAWDSFLDTPIHVNKPAHPIKIVKTSKPMTLFTYEDGTTSVMYDVRPLYDLLLTEISSLIAKRIQ